MQIGNIVEYIDRQKIICAVVLEIHSQRLRLLSENAREVSLSSQRLSHTSDLHLDPSTGRDGMVKALKEVANRRNVLSDRIDIKSLWEVLNTEQEWIDLATMTDFVFPDTRDADHESAVVRAFFKNRLFFKFNTNAFFPYTEEQAQLAKSKAEAEEKRQRLISHGIAWLKSVLPNQKLPSKNSPEGDLREVVDILKSYYLFGKDAECHIVAKMILTGAGIQNPEDIFQILIKTGIWHENENLDLQFYRVPVEFPEEVLRHASELKNNGASAGLSVSPGGIRKDLTDLSLLTIDGQSTMDFDDALSVEDKGDHYRVGIHISDVGHHIRKGDIIDQEALLRASSIYLSDNKIPMIPPELSENICSLVAGQHRAAISIMVKITPNGKIIGSEIFPSIVTVGRQLTYTDANLLAESDADIALLHTIGRIFRRKRLDDGAIHISLPEISVGFENNGTPKIIRIERESPSRMLISELMILANSVMAEFLIENRMPAIFRSQQDPRERLFQGENDSLFQNWMQRKALSRFALNTHGGRHSGLGLEAYVTATSPIRKCYDLITQRQIRAIFGLESPYTEEEILSLLKKLEHPMGYVPKIQFVRNRYWLLKHLESRIGQKEEAIVLAKRKNGYLILLPTYMMECVMPRSGNIKLKPEDYIQITIQHVNARKDDLSVFMG
jgi:exoribonuclease-2